MAYNSGGFTGDANLSITINDNGNTGEGGALSDTQTIALSVAQDVGTLGNRALTFQGSLSTSDTIDRYQFTLGADTTTFCLTLGGL
ncbi:MAG: hypothetical protein RLZZ597_3689 [Cyanobacteriota bacterium]